MLHRDPVVATSSFYSMVWHSNRLLSHDTSPELLARHWFRKTQRMIGKMLSFREGTVEPVGAAAAMTGTNATVAGTHPGAPGTHTAGGVSDIIDISYYDLTTDPMRVVERVYERFGMSLSTEARERMRSVLQRHRRDKYGVHRYHSASFGITRAESEAAFAEYRDRFSIPREYEE
jgi:hypothetical protein